VKSGPFSLALGVWNMLDGRTGGGSLNLVREARIGMGCEWASSGEESAWSSECHEFLSSSLSCVDESEMSLPLLVLEDR